MAFIILGASIPSFYITAFLYAISLTIAFSPLGEWILKIVNHARPLKTREEIDYLMPIFEDVYCNALKLYPSLNKNIKLHIIDDLSINAFAIGRSIIAVNTGMVEAMSEEEIKGILAHEFGHISNGDTKALLLSVVGNGVFSLAFLLIKGILSLLEFILKLTGTGAHLIFTGIKWVFGVVVFIFMYIGQIILSINSRKNEYRADSFAYDIGNGNNLLEALYLLQKLNMNKKMSLNDKLKSSHPHITDRIQRLENLVY